jgi:superfamily II DNA or RNA helicase
MQLRDYQEKAETSILNDLTQYQSTLGVLATGLGKTVIGSYVIKKRLHLGRAMWIAHREELIYQAARTIRSITNVDVAIEMGDEKSNEHGWAKAPIVVATVQTLTSRFMNRMCRFDPKEFATIAVDEAHHSTGTSYRKALGFFLHGIEDCWQLLYGAGEPIFVGRRVPWPEAPITMKAKQYDKGLDGWKRKVWGNPECRVIALTATPDRHDEESLGQIYDSVAFNYEIPDAINDGWLVPIKQRFVHVDSLDLSQVRTQAGDLNASQLQRIMEMEENLHKIVHPTIELAGGRKTLVFAVGVEQAERMCEIFNRHKLGSAAFICGKTDKEERRHLLRLYAEGEIQFMVNVGCLCLDSETEILTDEGWVGMDEMTYDHRVANWDQGKIFFEEPKYIVRRKRMEGERMVSLETKNRSIRVTEDHRMLYRTSDNGEFLIKHAIDLAGKMAELPISGKADPMRISAEETQKNRTSLNRRIQANSYNLRKTDPTLSLEKSKAEAERRIKERDSLRVLQPHELSLDECRFIGIWIGDGTVTNLQKGGVEYSLSQSVVYPTIIKFIDRLIKKMGIDFVKRQIKGNGNNHNSYRWSFPRGTGFGPQKRNGLYHLEPYLKKDGTYLFWGLNENQFDAMIHGLSLADGDHGDSTKMPKSTRIVGVNRNLFDLLQAVAVCRGYRANLKECSAKKRKPHHQTLLRLSLSKRVGHIMTKYCMQVEDDWKQEMVWCVTSTTGNIITRRNGTVTVTGNTEGFDDPGIELIAMARPTKSRSLYSQMVGRGTRPLPGTVDGLVDPISRRSAIACSMKPSIEIMDFVGNTGTHRLVTTLDILGGNYTIEAVDKAISDAKSGGVHDSAQLLEESEEAVRIENERIKRQANNSIEMERRKRILAKALYSTTKVVDVFDAIGVQPQQVRGWNAKKEPTEKQLELLRKRGIVGEKRGQVHERDLNKGTASQLIDSLMKRQSEKKCTYKQAKLLKRYGYPTDMSFENASKTIDAIASNGWKRPAAKVPEVAEPFQDNFSPEEIPF